jgi:hypothetical protein
MSEGPQEHLLVTFKLIQVHDNCCYAKFNFIQKLKQKYFYPFSVFFADIVCGRFQSASK